MVVPVTGKIPDSTLTPFQVRQKFSPQSLAGLGDDCSDGGGICQGGYDEDGNCTYCDYSLASAPPTPIDFATNPTYKQPDGSPWPFDPSIASAKPTLVSTYTDAGGDLVGVLSDGSTYTIQPGGNVVKGGGGTPAQHTVTSQQASAWPAFINALSKAGVQLGTVAMLQPGQTLLPNGTILGSGQSLVGPRGTGINSSVSSILQNPVLLIGGFGILALLVLSGGRR